MRETARLVGEVMRCGLQRRQRHCLTLSLTRSKRLHGRENARRRKQG